MALSGTVRGINEDGPNRQQLDGYFFFDLESNHISYLTFKGVHVLLDRDGKESGRVEGRFVLTPTPGYPVSLERRVVAIAIADQVGAANRLQLRSA